MCSAPCGARSTTRTVRAARDRVDDAEHGLLRDGGRPGRKRVSEKNPAPPTVKASAYQ